MGLISAARNAYGQLSLKRVVLFCLQFCLVIACSLTTPFLVRWFFAVPFVELSVPLDFVFRTCDQQLSGVCSYPEATVALDEVPTKLDQSYYYGFTVHLTLFDTSQNRALGLFLVQLQAKDEALAVVSTYQKTLLVKHTPPSTGFFVKIRNIIFFPLYLIGYFGEPVAEPLMLVLTNKHRENAKAPTKFLAVQLQNRFIQIESATLFIHAHVGWSGYVFTEYPLITYVSLFSVSASIYFIIFALYWASKGFRLMAVDPAENRQQEQNSSRPNRRARSGLRNIPGLRHPSSTGKRVVDEPPPDIWNRDEVPECPLLSDVPGWNVVPGSQDDRTRTPERPDIVSSTPPSTTRRFRDEAYPRNGSPHNGTGDSFLHRRPVSSRKPLS